MPPGKQRGLARDQFSHPGFFGVFLFLLYGWIYRLNQRAVRDQLEPRRSDLQKLITYLEGESHAEDASEMMDLASALSGTDGNAGLSPNWANWAENWNRIIPSWGEVALIIVPTLAGAYLGFRFPLADMGPVFFQSVVAAVIPFEIAFFSLWYLSYQRHKGATIVGQRQRASQCSGDCHDRHDHVDFDLSLRRYLFIRCRERDRDVDLAWMTSVRLSTMTSSTSTLGCKG